VTAGKSEMSARLRNESASAKRGARSGAGQRSTSSLSHARPGCAGADKRKLRNVESRDGLDKDLEMQKEPNGVLISSAGQPSERGGQSTIRTGDSTNPLGSRVTMTSQPQDSAADAQTASSKSGQPRDKARRRTFSSPMPPQRCAKFRRSRVERKRSPGRGKLSRRWS